MMHSVVTQILSLPTGERLFVKDEYFHLIFETSDLSNASPIVLAHCVSFLHNLIQCICTLACWSSGMIPVSGAGGPGFNSQTSPLFFHLLLYVSTGCCLSWFNHIGMEGVLKIMAC